METLILIAAAVYGACIGSFLNVCIFRFPRRCLRLWRPKLSFCPACRRQILWYENLPIVAFLALTGRCRGCKAKIPLRYFFVELGTAFFVFYLADRYVAAAPGRQWGTFGAQAVFGFALIVCALVDADWSTIPDEVDIPGFLLAPLVAWIVVSVNPVLEGSDEQRLLREYSLLAGAPDLASLAHRAQVALASALPWWGASSGVVSALSWPFATVESALTTGALSGVELQVRAAFAAVLGAGVGAAIIYLIGLAGERAFGMEAMGFGDVKLMAMIGGFTGWQGVLGSIVVASLLGSVWGIASKIRSGKTTVTGKDLAETTPLGYWSLRLFGAPSEAPDGAVIALRPGGSLAARLATGNPYLPFGPFLALGAAIVALWPRELLQLYTLWAECVRRPFGG